MDQIPIDRNPLVTCMMLVLYLVQHNMNFSVEMAMEISKWLTDILVNLVTVVSLGLVIYNNVPSFLKDLKKKDKKEDEV